MATTVRKKAAAKRGATSATRKSAATKPPARKAAAKKAAAKKAVAKKTAAKKTAAKKAVAKKTAPRQAAARKTTARKAAPRKAGAKQSTKKPAKKSGARRRITPAQALANTRKLLEAKQAHDREPAPWQAALEGGHVAPTHAGFQDEQARDQANALHAGESHLEAIQGAIGTRDRHNQGKRDQR